MLNRNWKAALCRADHEYWNNYQGKQENCHQNDYGIHL